MLYLLVLYAVNIILNGVSINAFVNPILRGNETDRLALLSIKSIITQDPFGVLDSWNDSNHFCEWKGVICEYRSKRVTIVDLSSNGLVGSLSPSIGNLSFLHYLDLSNNTFSGHIPPEIGSLIRLEKLRLISNSFEGEIPTSISGCTRLIFLQLSYNKLVGKLPIGLSFLTKLSYFSVKGNNLIGDDLSPLANLTSLQVLSLTNQNVQGGLGFSGRIPDFLGNFKKLTILDLGGNSFNGNIPHSLYNLSNIQIFSIPNNLLEGVLPRDFGFYFPQLRWLQLFRNQLSGSIPSSLSNLSNIEYLQLSENNFVGKFLFDGSNMPNLFWFELEAAIMGKGKIDELDFINTFVNCTNLNTLIVSDNNFGGNIPLSIANLSVHIKRIDLATNHISGSIPLGLGNLLSLQWLNLEFNQLTGAIPSDIGNISNLETLFLSHNLLSGKIPSSLGNLSKLSLLDMSHNKFHGFVPTALGNCKNLLRLDLSSNKLTGYIPGNLFQILGLVELHLKNNTLKGPLPSEIGDLKNLIILDMSINNMYGNIPDSLSQCLGLVYLSFHDNFFNGSIPSSFSQLKSLQFIDLSINKLSGQVLKYFLNFSYLTYLNLSFNNLEGDVPTRGVFSNVSSIFLVGNDKLCGGIPQLKLPRCTMTKSKATKMSRVLFMFISITCFVLGLTIMFLIYSICTKRRKNNDFGVLGNGHFRRLSYGMLLKATNGFSIANLIGSGSFSYVYKGTLLIDGVETSVAIKVLANLREGASQSFLTECEVLRIIRHRNLVRVLTSCSSIDFQGNAFNAIVYELMSNGSLERWLYSDSGVDGQFQSLNLLQRLNIAIDVAHALEYIQSVYKNPFIHCDLKPSNILLDDDFVAHVGDFGLVELPLEIAETLPNYISLGIRGTAGYTAPEYGVGNSMSTAGDIYSFGIILLELMTVKKPTDVMFEGDMNLHKFAKSALSDRVYKILDPRLINLDDKRVITNCVLFECISSIITIGVRCSSELPQDRMKIKDVIPQLQSQKDLLLCWRNHRC